MITPQHVPAVVASRRDVSAGLWIVRIKPDEKISFTPGQYATVGLAGETRLVERPYSIASSPREEELEFFLELVPGGHLTSHLYDVAAGGQVWVRRDTKGRFLFDDKSGHPSHFMIATVTGAAPFVSMLREFVNRHEEGRPVPYHIALLHAASISRELGYCEELSGYARRYSWFTYIPTVSRIWLDPGWSGERGRAEDVVRRYMDTLGFDSDGTTAYACGNPDMIENVKAVLERSGFPKQFIRQEVYWVAGKGD